MPSPPRSLLISPATIFTESLLSRTAELLKSNTPILDVEKESYRHIINLSGAILRSLDVEVGSSLEDRGMIALHRSRAMSVTNPLRSLPAEVLKEIFHYASWSYSHYDFGNNDVLQPSHPLWSLSQVCAKWRDVALRDWTLWSFLRLDFRMYDEDEHAYTRRLALFLERSRGCLLDVWITEGSNPVFRDYPHLLVLLENSIHRWKNLVSMLCASSVQLFSGCAFNALEVLHLEPESSGGMDEMVDTFKNARALRSLSVYSETSVAFDVPWSGLKTLMVNDLSLHCNVSRAVLDELSNMPQLVELDLTLPRKKSWREDWTSNSQVHTFLHMEKLTLHELVKVEAGEMSDNEVLTLREIFSRLSVPSLKKLCISSYTTLSAFPVLRHPDSLTSLEIHFDPGNIGVLRFLETTTNVEVLTLGTETADSIQGLIDGLTLNGSEKMDILPRLAHLDMRPVLWRFSMDVLLPLLESRIGKGMQTVIVDKNCPASGKPGLGLGGTGVSRGLRAWETSPPF